MGQSSGEIAGSDARARRGGALGALRDGTWLTPARLTVYPRIVGLALLLAVVALFATSHGGLDRWGRPLGTDFSGVWVAGAEVRSGQPALPYDNAAHAVAQAAAFGRSDSFLPWPYPPFFLAIAGALAALPYLGALVLWQGGTLILYLVAVRRALAGMPLARRDWLVVACAFPAVSINLLHGQNAFLSSGLLALGAFHLPRRPRLAGALLGLLAYKPQFALAIPVVLLAGRHWRAALAAAATVVLMTTATLVAFGPAPWQAFFASLSFMRRVVLEMGGLESYKLQSAFAAVRLLGGSVALAYAVQVLVGAVVLGGLAWLWHGANDARLKVAALIVASLLTTPYAMDYDMVMLGPALAALVALGLERGFPPYRKSLLALAWATPLLARPTGQFLALPMGVLVMAALFAALLVEARHLGEPASTISQG